eukprot:scaffold20751_cov124-Isochrysis_galbana.AAC.3
MHRRSPFQTLTIEVKHGAFTSARPWPALEHSSCPASSSDQRSIPAHRLLTTSGTGTALRGGTVSLASPTGCQREPRPCSERASSSSTNEGGLGPAGLADETGADTGVDNRADTEADAGMEKGVEKGVELGADTFAAAGVGVPSAMLCNVAVSETAVPHGGWVAASQEGWAPSSSPNETQALSLAAVPLPPPLAPQLPPLPPPPVATLPCLSPRSACSAETAATDDVTAQDRAHRHPRPRHAAASPTRVNIGADTRDSAGQIAGGSEAEGPREASPIVLTRQADRSARWRPQEEGQRHLEPKVAGREQE